MAKKTYTLYDDIFNIVIINVKLIDKLVNVIPNMSNTSLLSPPDFLNYINKNHFKLLNSHALVTTRTKLKDYIVSQLIKDYLFKDITKEDCTIAIGPCFGKQERYFKLFHINDHFRKNNILSPKVFQSHNNINKKVKSFYDLVGSNKFNPKDKPEHVYILVFDHLVRTDLQTNELNKLYILKYLELFPIKGLGDLESSCNLFRKQQKPEKEIGDYLGQRGLNIAEINYIIKQLPNKTVFDAVNFYMNLRLSGLYFTEPQYQDIYID